MQGVVNRGWENMGFFQAVRKCAGDWITFSGRAPRSEYWWFYLAYILLLAGVIASVVLSVMVFDVSVVYSGETNGAVLALLILLGPIAIFVFIAQISVTVRRLHDRNLSGWWLGLTYLLSAAAGFAEETAVATNYINFASIGGSVALFVVTLLKGTEGPNRYGEDPLNGFSAEVFE